MDLRESQLRGEESLSIVRRGPLITKYYKLADPSGRWPTRELWREQIEDRRRASFHVWPVRLHPIQAIGYDERTLWTCTYFLESVRPATADDSAEMRRVARESGMTWLGDIKTENIIVSREGPTLIDFSIGPTYPRLTNCAPNDSPTQS